MVIWAQANENQWQYRSMAGGDLRHLTCTEGPESLLEAALVWVLVF